MTKSKTQKYHGRKPKEEFTGKNLAISGFLKRPFPSIYRRFREHRHFTGF